MKKSIQSLCCIVCTVICTMLFVLPSYGQRLPDQMQLSEDGTRLTTGGVASEGFYNEADIPTISLEFEQANFWQLLNQNYDDKISIEASITITYGEEEVSFDQVGVRYKGQTSYFQNNTDKKSFAISLDEYVEGQDVDGYNNLNLQCGWLDPSYIKEVLYLNTNRKNIPAAQGNFVKVIVNGEDQGIYANVQQLNKDFLKEWFVSNDGTLWRCEDPNSTVGGGGPGGGGPGGGGPGGGGPGGGGTQFGAGTSSINYLGEDVEDYEAAYTIKSTGVENPWDALIAATDVLENTPDDELEEALKGYLNVDRTLWFLAHEIMFSDDDGYVFKGGMDYFLYWEPETNELVPLEYDGNTCLELDNVDWSIFYRENDENFPLCNRLFNIPSLRQRYLAHVRTMLEETFNPTVLNPQIDVYENLLDGKAGIVPNAIYSENEFQNGVEEVKEFVQERYSFYMDNQEVDRPYLDIANARFTVNDVENQSPLSTETVKLEVEVGHETLGANVVKVHYATGFVGSFETMEMTDTENDGTFEAELPAFPAGTYIRYYFEAQADNDLDGNVGTLSFYPKGAEHDVFLYRVQASPSTTVVINELMASNDQTQSDEFNEFDDWVELYNLTDEDIDLSDYSLSDNYTIPTRWQFEEGTTIGANDYLIVWIDDDGTQGPLHTSYNLSAEGEQVILSDADQNVVDEVTYGAQETDQSYARIPNGTGDFIINTPTFSINNEGEEPNGVEELTIGRLLMYPNPTVNALKVVLEAEVLQTGNLTLKAFDLAGRNLLESPITTTTSTISVDGWNTGTYVFSIFKDGIEVQTSKIAIIR